MTGPFDGRRFDFAACGEDVTIYEWTRVLNPDGITIGNHVIIDDFVFLDGKGEVRIGSWNHIAGYTSIVGGGRLVTGDFCGIAAGSRIITGTDLADGTGLIGPVVPDSVRAVHRGYITMEDHVFVGTNAVVQTDVTIGEGAVVGAGAVVTRDLEPWTINVGVPARPVKDRPRDRMLELAAELRAAEGSGTGAD